MFWDFFEDLCLSVGKKPNTVCRELGFSSATATHWKNQTTPNGDALCRIADYFGVSVDYLLGREITDSAGNGWVGHKKTYDEAHRILDRLYDDNVRIAQDFMEFLCWKQDHKK